MIAGKPGDGVGGYQQAQRRRRPEAAAEGRARNAVFIAAGQLDRTVPGQPHQRGQQDFRQQHHQQMIFAIEPDESRRQQ